jgi:hypothetical protein
LLTERLDLALKGLNAANSQTCNFRGESGHSTA